MCLFVSQWKSQSLVRCHHSECTSSLWRQQDENRALGRQERSLWSVFCLPQIKKSIIASPQTHVNQTKHIKKRVSHNQIHLYKRTNTDVQKLRARSLNQPSRIRELYANMFLTPSWFFLFLHICHTLMLKIIKQILIFDKDNPGKYKVQFLNDYIY